MRLEQLQQMETATRLIRRGMRISIVSNATRINSKTLRILYHDIHGRGPAAGQMPSCCSILSTRAMQATASVFASLYLSIGGFKIANKINLSALISAYDLYLELCQELSPIRHDTLPINISQAWIIARDISINAAHIHSCRCCHIQYLVANDSRLAPSCPLCALKA